MLKYVDTQVTFAEIPDEISLCISISNCHIRCKGCHSRYLWKDTGEPLTEEELHQLIDRNAGITCVCFMGGDIAPDEINSLAGYVRKEYPQLKIGWYSGTDQLTIHTEYCNFDFIKFGPYVKELGGLISQKTNQRLYSIKGGKFTNITSRFWKRDAIISNNSKD